MKFKNLLPVLAAGLFGLPFVSCGQEDLSALRQKAEQGDAKAQFFLGSAYADGEDFPQDYKEAVRWYRRAAEQGYVAAERSLGRAYADGNGVLQDYAQAYAWFNIAVTQGDDVTAKTRTALMTKMTPAQIAEGQRLSREYAEKLRKK